MQNSKVVPAMFEGLPMGSVEIEQSRDGLAWQITNSKSYRDFFWSITRTLRVAECISPYEWAVVSDVDSNHVTYKREQIFSYGL
jgi:hypothetical protein